MVAVKTISLKLYFGTRLKLKLRVFESLKQSPVKRSSYHNIIHIITVKDLNFVSKANESVGPNQTTVLQHPHPLTQLKTEQN